MDEYIGSKVEITTVDGAQYHGVVHAADKLYGKLTLKEVISLKSKAQLPGLQHYFKFDLKNVFLIEEKKKDAREVKTDMESCRQGGFKFLRRKSMNSHLKTISRVDRSAMYSKTAHSDDNKSPNVSDKLAKLGTRHGTVPCKLPKSKVMNYTVLYNTGMDFREAIATIGKHKLIGLSAEGSCLGRDGSMYLLQVALPNECIVFDVKTIGAGAVMSSGLGDVLENPRIQKVMHNCRMLSDYLHHVHKIRLVNVFDTQVADIIVYRNCHKGDLPRYVKALAQLLDTYLPMVSSDLHKSRARTSLRKEDETNFWGARPVSEECEHVAVFNVMYLLYLQSCLHDDLFQPLRDGVDIFLSTVRDANGRQHRKKQDNNHLVPDELIDFKPSGEPAQFVENSEQVSDNRVVFSIDGVCREPDPNFNHTAFALEMRERRMQRSKSVPSRSKSVECPSVQSPPSVMQRGIERGRERSKSRSNQVQASVTDVNNGKDNAVKQALHPSSSKTSPSSTESKSMTSPSSATQNSYPSNGDSVGRSRSSTSDFSLKDQKTRTSPTAEKTHPNRSRNTTNDYIGRKVEVTTVDGAKYHGTLRLVDDNGMLTLDKVYSVKSKMMLSGLQRYLGYDLKNVTLHEEKPKDVSVKTNGCRRESNPLSKQETTSSIMKNRRLSEDAEEKDQGFITGGSDEDFEAAQMARSRMEQFNGGASKRSLRGCTSDSVLTMKSKLSPGMSEKMAGFLLGGTQPTIGRGRAFLKS